MSQESLAQWLGIFYLPPHWLYPTWPLLRGYEPNGIIGPGSSPRESLYVSRRDRFRENLKGVLDLGSRLLYGAEKSFRVNPSSLVNSGAVVRRICAAKLSKIGAFSMRWRLSYSNRTYEQGIFLVKE